MLRIIGMLLADLVILCTLILCIVMAEFWTGLLMGDSMLWFGFIPNAWLFQAMDLLAIIIIFIKSILRIWNALDE